MVVSKSKRRAGLALLAWLGVMLAAALPAVAAESDNLVYDRVMRALVNDPLLKTDAFKVEVQDGIVTVQGQVRDEKLLKRVDRVVRKAKGVKGVINKVIVRR